MNTTLLIPALFPVFAPRKDLRLPALERILARGQWNALAGQPVTEDWAAPVAQDRAKQLARPQGHWLCADPAHVRVEGSRALFLDAGKLEISSEEAQALVESLNRHFQEDGLRFWALSPWEWLVESHQPILLETTWPPLWCAGRNLEPWLPQGPEQSLWRRHFNEIQMLFFEHPVNLERQKRGEPTLDALWFWNRGSTQSNPPDLLAGLRQAAAYEETEVWEQALEQLEKEVLAPLLKKMHRGEVQSITLLCPEGEQNYAISVTATKLRWHFWKTNQPLHYYHARHHRPKG